MMSVANISFSKIRFMHWITHIVFLLHLVALVIKTPNLKIFRLVYGLSDCFVRLINTLSGKDAIIAFD